jgi:8-oxo-dGTP pyrophosphatase MutT (NUDIX family)
MKSAVIPSKASTIVVVKPDGRGRFEVLMTRRAPNLPVLGGFLVFPGGGLEDVDWSERMLSRCRGLSPLRAQQLLGTDMTPEQSMGHWVAAVRELFEEAGLHFFIDESGAAVHPGDNKMAERLGQKRQTLAAGRLDLPSLLESEGLFCDVGRLAYLFHRITPDQHRVRFDTRFYLAAVPDHQIALPSSEEVAESLWITPKMAIERHNSGDFPMMPPTIIVLRTLVEHESWQSLLRAYGLAS